MDDQRFDDLTRRLASRTSRRGVLRLLAGGALGGLAGVAGLGRARAASCATDRDCPPGQRCDASTATCVTRGGGNGRPANQTQSQSIGIAAACATDAECAPGETCVEGVCTRRGGACTRGSGCTADATCCGGEVCDTLNGVCVGAGGRCTNDTGTCSDSLDCCGNEQCVDGLCQRTAGGCAPGAACAADAECCGGQVCADGACARAARRSGCPEGQVRCRGACVDILTDPNNCGGCDATCGDGLTCVGGECTGTIFCDVDEDCPPYQTCTFCRGGGCRCLPCDEWLACPVYDENGRCSELCPGCDECIRDGAGGQTCRGECPPCTVCDEQQGMCVFGCGRCESCQDDGSGNLACVSSCGSCSHCDEALGCVYDCDLATCQTCALAEDGNEICVSACTEGQECQLVSTDPPQGACVTLE